MSALPLSWDSMPSPPASGRANNKRRADAMADRVVPCEEQCSLTPPDSGEGRKCDGARNHSGSHRFDAVQRLAPPRAGSSKKPMGALPRLQSLATTPGPDRPVEASVGAAETSRRAAKPSGAMLVPVRDSPNNPFLAENDCPSSPSSVRLWHARKLQSWHRSMRKVDETRSKLSRGTMTYLFRGTKVTYVEPQAESDSEEERDISAEGESADESASDVDLETQQAFYPHGTAGPPLKRARNNQLQPKLLFPSAGKPKGFAASTLAALANHKPHAPPSAGPGVPPPARSSAVPSKKGGDDDDDDFGGRPSSPKTRNGCNEALLARLADWSDDEDEEVESPRGGAASRNQHLDAEDRGLDQMGLQKTQAGAESVQVGQYAHAAGTTGEELPTRSADDAAMGASRPGWGFPHVTRDSNLAEPFESSRPSDGVLASASAPMAAMRIDETTTETPPDMLGHHVGGKHDAGGGEDDDDDENPFLDVAPPSRAPLPARRVAAHVAPRRGHSHGLAHRMHVPNSHLGPRRPRPQ